MYQYEFEKSALVHFDKVSIPSLDLLLCLGWLFFCLLLGIHMILAILNDLC